MGKSALVRVKFSDRDPEFVEIRILPVPGDGTLVWYRQKTWTVTSVVHDWDTTTETRTTVYLKRAGPAWKGCTQAFFCGARHLDMRGLAATHEQAAELFGLCGDEPFVFEEVHLVVDGRCVAYVLTEPQIARLLAAGAGPLGSES